jgi:hypothetical protein
MSDLQSCEPLFSEAIARTLAAPPATRVALFETLMRELSALAADPAMELKEWKCEVYDGTDGSRIFRGGIGTSIVIDGDGRMWRARSYEDFDTTYTITPVTCVIATLTPHYDRMREYLPRETKTPPVQAAL